MEPNNSKYCDSARRGKVNECIILAQFPICEFNSVTAWNGFHCHPKMMAAQLVLIDEQTVGDKFGIHLTIYYFHRLVKHAYISE